MTHDQLTALDEAARGDIPQVLRAYTDAGRPALRTIALPPDLKASLAASVPAIDFARWEIADFLRVHILLTRAAALGDAACTQAAMACYEAGDAGEQASWLRGVSLLPSPAQFTPIVIEACRSNILPVFQAVASGNPFPDKYFPERNFNQMVLKAMFNGVPLSGIVGLDRRRNAELARMASDYADERRAAGRSVPEDIGLAL